MLTAVLCLVDIIKHNETLMHPNNRGQTNKKMVQYKHKPHLLDTCLVLIHDIYTIYPVMKTENKIISLSAFSLQTARQTINKTFFLTLALISVLLITALVSFRKLLGNRIL